MLSLKKLFAKYAQELKNVKIMSFSPSANRTVTDADDAPDGIIYCSTNVANTPEDYLIIMTTSISGYRLQVGFQMSSPSKIYTRKKSNGASAAWSSWKYASLTS